ncbi:MAG: sensor histidine kinase [bacterium]
MLKNRRKTVYVVLLIVWIAFVIWEMSEHKRVIHSAREGVLNQARDISSTVATIVRSQRMFGLVSQFRLEGALEEMIGTRNLIGIALYNASGESVLSAGEVSSLRVENVDQDSPRWDRDTVTIMNLVDLGVAMDDDGSTASVPLLIMPSRGAPDDDEAKERKEDLEKEDRDRRGRGDDDKTSRGLRYGMFEALKRDILRTSESVVMRLEFPPDTPVSGPGSLENPRPQREGGKGRSRFHPRNLRRPFWMAEEEYQAMLEKQGLHSFVFKISTQEYHAEVRRDFWLRAGLIFISLLAVGGVGFAWRNMQRTSQLQMRLLRASEMNTHLREMNVAAAGLAHETRNPLNIVRAQAQVITRNDAASPEIQTKANSIIQEVDRVTGRLNEFIDYSRPREPRPAPTALADLARDVERALETDIEDKSVQFEIDGPNLMIMADSGLLRQILFNLMMNAIQAVGEGGTVHLYIERTPGGEAFFDICDNGPGVSPELRDEIFRPYFTTNEQGTGLGLAVVRQIVLAHHWDITYLDGKDGGACFRVSGIQVLASNKASASRDEQ